MWARPSGVSLLSDKYESLASDPLSGGVINNEARSAYSSARA